MNKMLDKKRIIELVKNIKNIQICLRNMIKQVNKKSKEENRIDNVSEIIRESIKNIKI